MEVLLCYLLLLNLSLYIVLRGATANDRFIASDAASEAPSVQMWMSVGVEKIISRIR